MPQNVFEMDISRGLVICIYPQQSNITFNRVTKFAIALHLFNSLFFKFGVYVAHS
jgi:hypothetical protein